MNMTAQSKLTATAYKASANVQAPDTSAQAQQDKTVPVLKNSLSTIISQ